MSTGDIIVMAPLVLMVGSAVYTIVRGHRSGRMCGGCNGCRGCGGCQKGPVIKGEDFEERR